MQLPRPSTSRGATADVYLLSVSFCFYLYQLLFKVAQYTSNQIDIRKYTEASTQTEPEGEGGAVEHLAAEEPPKKAKDVSWMLENAKLERFVWTTTIDAIPPSANEVAPKEATELLCGYSWKRTPDPTIYVPGTPATYTPPDFVVIGQKDGAEITGPVQLPEDTSSHWVDQHAERVSLQQFESIFQAATAMNKDLRFNKVKIVVSGSSLMQLHSFLRGRSSQAFHLELQIVNDILFIERKVRSAKTVSREGSYGRSFEHCFTTEDPELEYAEGHHRVLGYMFCGIYMAIRIEADACVANHEYNLDALVVLLPDFDPLLGTNAGIVYDNPQRTKVIIGGILVPHAQLMELKSNDKTKPKEQMWFGRTPICVLGTHTNGLFKKSELKYMTQEETDEWEENYQLSLRKLAWLLEELRTVVKEQTSGGSAVLVCMGKEAPLVMYETKIHVDALPKEIVDVFWD
jgi:hypothetical protein